MKMIFNESNSEEIRKGKAGEKIVKKFLLNRPKTEKIVDVTENEHQAEEDVDFILYQNKDENTKMLKIEVKTDERAEETGNLFIEKSILYISGKNRGKTTKGWYFTSKADIFIFYVPTHKAIYTISRKKLDNFIKSFLPQTRQCNDGQKVITGYCINIEKLVKHSAKKYDVSELVEE